MQKKKILYIIDSLARGGAETILVNTLKELTTKSDWPVFLVTTISSKNEFGSEIPSSVTYKHFNCAGKNFINGVDAIRKFIKREKFDIIHSHLYNSVIISRLASTSRNKLISTYHNLDFQIGSEYYSNWRVWLDRVTYRKRYFSIYVSKQVQLSVERIRPKNSPFSVLPNFASRDFKPYYEIKDDSTLKLVSIGNLKSVKNHNLSVEAFSRLTNYPISLDIYGEGVLYNELYDRIKANKAEIYLKGKQLITTELLSKYDLFLMTSKNEGMPISLLEAISFGMPCILPEHLPIMKEIADDAALYFSIRDLSSLVNTILSIHKNKQQLIEMNKAALKRAKLHSAERHIEELLKIYRN